MIIRLAFATFLMLTFTAGLSQATSRVGSHHVDEVCATDFDCAKGDVCDAFAGQCMTAANTPAAAAPGAPGR